MRAALPVLPQGQPWQDAAVTGPGRRGATVAPHPRLGIRGQSRFTGGPAIAGVIKSKIHS